VSAALEPLDKGGTRSIVTEADADPAVVMLK
jgi:hypothetical protein